jgi:actin-related protein
MNWRNNLNKRLIIDNGSSTVRVGTAASEQPNECWANMYIEDN